MTLTALDLVCIMDTLHNSLDEEEVWDWAESYREKLYEKIKAGLQEIELVLCEDVTEARP